MDLWVLKKKKKKKIGNNVKEIYKILFYIVFLFS